MTGPHQPTLLLSSDDVAQLYSMNAAISVIETAFVHYANGDAQMPAKVYLNLPEFNGDFRAMPATSTVAKVSSVKWVNSHAGNPGKGYPAVMAMLILNDSETAVPLSVMDAMTLTGIRTGAAGGVAAKYLSRPDSRSLAFVGAGQQALYQYHALSIVRDISEVRVVDPNPESISTFCEYIRSMSDVSIVEADSVEDCVLSADIVTTTTPLRSPVVLSDMIEPGVHINAIGADAPGKQELDVALLQRARVVVDDIDQASHSGEINVGLASGDLSPDGVNVTLGDVLTGRHPGREGADDITVFDSTGLAIQDLMSADWVYRAAKDQGLGTNFCFF